jgi:TPP-dependent pyruvate/acetoin dehydrogenase alpha subunit
MINISDKALFSSMLRIRMIEESIAERYHEGMMRCPTHLSIGQEAISVGVCSNLNNQDMVLSTHRAHAHYLSKGGNLKRMIAEIHGKKTGCSKGMGGSMHLIDRSVGFMGSTAIVGNTIPVAVGIGLSLKLKSSKSISCVFFGDGAVEEGVFYESVNFAIVHKLPVLFICENNLYSVYSGLEVRQPSGRKINNMTRSIGIDSSYENGNDVIKVSNIVSKAKDKIKLGYGPQFIEFETYRWREHCGPNFDNDIGYRDESEFLDWKKRDPLLNIKKIFSKQDLIILENNIKQEIHEAFDFAGKSEYPKFSDLKEVFNLSYS